MFFVHIYSTYRTPRYIQNGRSIKKTQPNVRLYQQTEQYEKKTVIFLYWYMHFLCISSLEQPYRHHCKFNYDCKWSK